MREIFEKCIIVQNANRILDYRNASVADYQAALLAAGFHLTLSGERFSIFNAGEGNEGATTFVLLIHDHRLIENKIYQNPLV
jgi:hypothetical protein